MKFEWKSLWKVGVVVFVFCLLWKYIDLAYNLLITIISALIPLFVGAIIAFFINILLSFYENKIFQKIKKPSFAKAIRPLSLVSAILTVIAMIVAVFSIVLPQFFSCLKLIINLFPNVMKWITEQLSHFEIVPDNILTALSGTDWNSKIEQIISVLTNGLGNTVQLIFSTITSVFSWLVTTLLSIIFAFYLLASKDKLARQSKRLITAYLPQKVSHKIFYVCHVFIETFRKYVIGQCTEALILGVLCILGMLILRLPYAAMIGVLIAVTALIPIAGAYVGAAVGALMIVTVSPTKALIFLVFLIILQQIEGNIIYPKVVGTSIGLPGIWVLVAVTVGGSVMGILGMLLGVPLTASIYRILRHDLRKRTSSNDNTKEADVRNTENTP